MAETIIRFGIIGSADIARKISRAIKLAPNATLFAIGSRSVEKAAKFASENGFPSEAKIYGSYEAVLDDPDVDAVYLPLPTSLHVHWAVLAAQKKKHVLLEKPAALNATEFDSVIKACESNGVQFMDGTVWIHHPRTAMMKDFLSDEQRFGQLKSIHSSFSVVLDPDFLATRSHVLNVLGDIGWYCIISILWATDFELPKTAVAMRGPVLNEAGMIISCGSSLYWEDGKVATFHCSFVSHLTMDMTASGTNGTLHVNDFGFPFEENEAYFSASSKACLNDSVTAWVRKPATHIAGTDLPQEAIMVKEFSRLVGNVKSGLKPEKKWLMISRKVQLVIDAVMESIERGFEAVEVGL